MRFLSRRSLTFRLTLLFSSSATLVLLILGFTVARAVNRHFIEQDMETLQGKLALVHHTFYKVRSAADLQRLPEQLDTSLVGHHGLAVLVRDAQGRVFFRTPGVDFPAALIEEARRRGEAGPVVWQSAGGHYRAIAGGMITSLPAWPGGVVAVATEISHHEEFMQAFQRTMWVIVAVAAVLLGFLGWVATRRGLLPLQQLVDSTAEVTASRLHHRLPTEAVPPELAELSASLNEMLARLEESFRRLSDFSSDLAHELRTPISNLMTETQVALSRARTADEYQEVLSSNAEELDRLARTVSDMLFLAKADNQLMTPSREPVRLEDEVRDLFEFYEALAEASSVRLALEGQGEVAGDRLMLRRALSNLLSNALRHAKPDSTVRIRVVREAGGWVAVGVENEGETIPPEQLPRLFDRFFRGDASRHRTTEGAGLGLAITASIVRAHGGSVHAASADGATTFTLRLPAAPSH